MKINGRKRRRGAVFGIRRGRRYWRNLNRGRKRNMYFFYRFGNSIRSVKIGKIINVFFFLRKDC